MIWVQNERYEIDPRSYDVWLETFSPTVRVSSATSRPVARLNADVLFSGKPRGGDYIGLAGAADGSFHAAWIDARDGAFRLYTARISVSK